VDGRAADRGARAGGARALIALDSDRGAAESPAMATRKLVPQSIALEPVKAELLAVLSKETRIPRAALLREAVDDLLAKYLRLAKERSK
jgi:hypothetical protein